MERLEKAAMEAFEAKPIVTTCKAADQDGYDGGFIAYDEENEAHGWTERDAKEALAKINSSKYTPKQ